MLICEWTRLVLEDSGDLLKNSILDPVSNDSYMSTFIYFT